MNLILFIHQDSSAKGAKFKRCMEQNFKVSGIEIFQTFSTFKSRLKRISNYDKEIFILFAESKDRLNELTSLIGLMEDKRIILILPDDSDATTSAAHHFFPRYFTYVSDAYDDLCAVIIKMTKQEQTNIILNNKGGN